MSIQPDDCPDSRTVLNHCKLCLRWADFEVAYDVADEQLHDLKVPSAGTAGRVQGERNVHLLRLAS